MNVQTRKNTTPDSPVFVRLGKDCVIQMWQKSANVPAMFAKTASFGGNDLAGAVKTKLPPPGLASERGLTNHRMEVRRG